MGQASVRSPREFRQSLVSVAGSGLGDGCYLYLLAITVLPGAAALDAGGWMVGGGREWVWRCVC